MVACSPEERLSGDGILGQSEQDQDSNAATAHGNDTTQITADDQGSAWPTAEGYTPLGDMFNFGSVLVAMPPEEEEHGHFYAPNSFVADPNALFGTINTTSHDNFYGVDNKDGIDGAEGNEIDCNHSDMNIFGDADDGFRDLANSALLALENDYEMTLRGEVRPSFMDSQPTPLSSPSMPLFDVTSLEKDTSDENFADFDSATIAPPITASPEYPLPEINTAAVQKAVAGITSKTSLEAKLQKWQMERQTKKHSLIPAAPLKAFEPSRNTPNAIQATASLTRSATIAESLHRLSYLLQCQHRLSIHLVGADSVECETVERLRSVLAPLVRWIGANLYSPRRLEIVLIGPNVPANMSSPTPIPLLGKPTQRLESATALCQEANYHDWLSENNRPDLVVCFNAGIWGYDDWKPTIRALVQYPAKIPFVVTSYTIEEAEDDHDVIQDIVQEETKAVEEDKSSQKPPCMWRPEANYFGSKQKRETATAVEGREYRENAAWQAWKL